MTSAKHQREGDAHPDDGFVAGDTSNHANFEENDSYGETAGHPLAVQLDFSFEDEVHGDGGGKHPDSRIGESGEAAGARAAHALFVVLDVETEWSTNKDAGDIEASNDTMELCKALAKTIGELHGPQQERAGGHDAVGQEIPFERVDVSPLWIAGINEETLVVDENIGEPRR
jgi:hypothetical protein